MIYLMEFIKGILIAFGILAGFISFIVYIAHKANKPDEYEADELIKPFEKYLQKVREEERYEEIEPVESMITSLRKSEVPDSVKLYKIKKDSSIHLNDEDGNTSLRFVTKYIIIKRIAEPA